MKLMSHHRNHGIRYDRMLLEHANYDFWILLCEKLVCKKWYRTHENNVSLQQSVVFSIIECS